MKSKWIFEALILSSLVGCDNHMEYNTIEINKANVNDYIDLDIVAFKWAAGGACGEPGGVIFITSDGRVFHTNYAFPDYGITGDDLCRIFPPLSSFETGVFGGGVYPPEWKDQYLGLGNYLVVRESIWDAFTRKAKKELEIRNAKGDSVILYNIWVEVVLKVLTHGNNTSLI